MPSGPARPRRVLIISASMGAGHDGAARELASRVAEAGHDVEVRDFLDSGPLHIGAALRSGYEFELKHAPSAYDATYRFWHRVPWLCPVVAWLVAALSRRRVLRWVGPSRPRRLRFRRARTTEKAADVVVSTYPLATLALGRLRRQGRLRAPLVNFITDFGVHPLWVHKGVDVNLAVHRRPAEAAHARTGRPSLACGPVVSAAFHAPSPEERSLARARFGLLPADRAVLIVAGSWGIGGVEETLRAVAESGRRYVPVVVCGRDEQLLARLQACAAGLRSRSVVLGWTDQMPAIMAACDALVENAGGLTSLEAFRSGLPVVSYQPIAGHGKENTAAMAAAGVSRFAADAEDLAVALEAVTSDGPTKAVQVATAAEMFADDGAALVLAVAGETSLIPSPVPGDWRPARWRRPARVAIRISTVTTIAAGLGWAGMTSGVELAAAAGIGVAHPAANSGSTVFVGARLTAAELTDPRIAVELKDLSATAVVDERTALLEPTAVQDLARAGVDVESGGRGEWVTGDGNLSRPALWNRAQDDARASRWLSDLTGQPVRVFVPGRRVNGFDLMACSAAHDSVVVPDGVLDANESETLSFVARHIYVLNGLGATPGQVEALLSRVQADTAGQGLLVAPLSALR